MTGIITIASGNDHGHNAVMDARSLAEAAGVKVLTLNAWVHRGLIPGVSVGSRGRPRDFDMGAAVHVALMVELVQLGLGAGTASAIARDRPQSKRLCLVFGMQPGELASMIGVQFLRRAPLPIGFDSEDELPGGFKRLGISPSVYTVINVEQIAARMQCAQE
jgi:hypothetical protein